MFSIEQIRRRPVHAAVFGGDSAAWAATQAIQVEALPPASARRASARSSNQRSTTDRCQSGT